ncbi:MAG: intradiol ring-cleavage dioxygenase [Alphaproteobacteria bacterium]
MEHGMEEYAMTRDPRDPLRRRTLAALAGGLAAASAPRLWAAEPRLTPTPRLTAGPFYPDVKPEDRDNDLLHFGGSAQAAEGTPFRLIGRVRNATGAPVENARIEIWQCDNRGVYHHAGGGQGGDPHFQGYGETRTGTDGRYRFLTIRPVPYGSRTPHIHFRVHAPGHGTLTTQMFLADEAERNARDWIYRHAGDAAAREALTVQVRLPRQRGQQAEFDIVLG